jgi:hypothetical protein
MFSTGDALAMNPWHHGIMAKRSNRKRDFMEVARNIVEHAISEQMDGRPCLSRNQTPATHMPLHSGV